MIHAARIGKKKFIKNFEKTYDYTKLGTIRQPNVDTEAIVGIWKKSHWMGCLSTDKTDLIQAHHVWTFYEDMH